MKSLYLILPLAFVLLASPAAATEAQEYVIGFEGIT